MDIATAISKATTVPKSGPALDISVESISPVKSMCQKSDEIVLEAFHYLSIELKKKNGLIRLRALKIIDILFKRSKIFRGTVADNIKQIVGASSLLKSLQNSSIQVSSHSTEIDAEVKKLIETWDLDYGDKYPQIHAVARYFKETLRLKMSNILATARRRQEQLAQQQQQANNVILLNASKIADTELSYTITQVSNILSRMNECFAILFPRLGIESSSESGSGSVQSGGIVAVERGHPSETTTATQVNTVYPESVDQRGDAVGSLDDDDVEYDDVDWIGDDDDDDGGDGGDQLEQQSFESTLAGGMPYTLEFSVSTTAQNIQTADNDVLFETIRELAGQLIRHIVPRLTQWKTVILRAIDILNTLPFREGHTNVNNNILQRNLSEGQAVNSVSSTSQSVLGKRSSSQNGDYDMSSIQTTSSVVVDSGTSTTNDRVLRYHLVVNEIESAMHRIEEVIVRKCKHLFL